MRKLRDLNAVGMVSRRLPLSGKQRLVNVVTRRDGNLRVELMTAKGQLSRATHVTSAD